jgi:hypothetical protein
MIRRKTKLGLAIGSVVALAAAVPAVVLAAGDTDDHVAPASTAIKATLKTGTVLTFKGTVSGVAVTATCTSSAVSFKTPATGLGPVPTTNPSFTGCKDNFGGAVTIRSNSTNGRWMTTFLDVANDEAGELAGDRVKLVIPKAGAVLTSTTLPGCSITSAPAGPAPLIAKYNDVNTARFSSAAVPTKGTGCTAGASGALTATYVLTPGMHDVS